MKLIDTLNEALGVPSNLTKTANEIYDIIDLDKINYILMDENTSITVNNTSKVISGNFKIGDEIYTKVMYSIFVDTHPNVKQVEMSAVSVETEIENIGGGKLLNKQDDDIKLIFNFICPGDDGTPYISDKNIKDGIRKYFIDNKTKLISHLSHELKHVYDHTKNRNESMIDLAKYNVVKNYVNWSIEPMGFFCYSLYYMSVAETLVRPSELASLIQSKNITKKGFLNFLNSDDTYIILNNIRNLTYENFYNDLFNYINTIKEHYPSDLTNNKSDEEIVDMFLTNIRLLLQNRMVEFIQSRLFFSVNTPKGILDLFRSDIDVIFLRRASKQIFKYSNNKDFYSNEINYNAKKADFVIRKLAKLYAITK